MKVVKSTPILEVAKGKQSAYMEKHIIKRGDNNG